MKNDKCEYCNSKSNCYIYEESIFDKQIQEYHIKVKTKDGKYVEEEKEKVKVKKK